MTAPTTPELPKPDLWLDASGFRGYKKDPGPGPWYSAESMRAALSAPASCAWTLNDDPDDSYWATACGEAFVFNDGGPAEHDFKHCCYCGGALVVAPPAGPVEQGAQQ